MAQDANPPPQGPNMWFEGEGYQPRPSLLQRAFRLGSTLAVQYDEPEYGLGDIDGGLILAVGNIILHLHESDGQSKWGMSMETLAEIPAPVLLEFIAA